nr:hypothetical protein [Streptomyces buecherae]
MDTAQDFRLTIQDRVLGFAQRDLQHGYRQGTASPRLAFEVPYQEGPRRRAGAEPAHDLPPSGQHVPGHCLQRVLLRLGLLLTAARSCPAIPGSTCASRSVRAVRSFLDERLLDVLQHLQEVVDGGQPPTRLVRGGRLHQVVDIRMQAVDQRARAQRLAALHARHDLTLARPRRLPCHQQISESAEAVHIEPHRIGLRDPQLRCQIWICRVRDVDPRNVGRRQAQRPTAARALSGGDLPVRDLRPRPQPTLFFAELSPARTAVTRNHMHRVCGQRAVMDPSRVSGTHGFRQLPHQSEPSPQVQALSVLHQVVVQAHGLRVVVEENRRTGRMPRRQIRLQLYSARVLEPAENRGLTGGGPFHRASLLVGGPALAQEDPHPR